VSAAEGLQPHQQRMVVELEELNAKRAALTGFFATPTFSSLSARDKRLLNAQLEAMEVYADILGMRIHVFKPTLASEKSVGE
jgi:hypothetical protein